MLCTNGVLLRTLLHGDGVDAVTHVVVDEVHERDKFADFLLIQLSDLLPLHPNLRLILMSATLHIDLFSSYFEGCPVVQVCTAQGCFDLWSAHVRLHMCSYFQHPHLLGSIPRLCIHLGRDM